MTNKGSSTQPKDTETIEPILGKIKDTVSQSVKILTSQYQATLYDITKAYEIIYGALSKYYEKLESLELPQNVNKEFLETLRKELDERLKPLEDQHIPLDVTVKDSEGKPVTKKVYVNAKVLIDAITEKFGLALWEHLAIRLPPPELYIMLIQHMDILYNRVAKLETSLKYITESLVTITEALALLDNMLRKLNNLYHETERALETFNESIKKYQDLLDSLMFGMSYKQEEQK